MIPSIRKVQSINQLNNADKGEETVIMATGAKIHRANIFARIIHSISIYKIEGAYTRIKTWASNRKKCYKKMGLAVNSIFRRNFYQRKFDGFMKIKKQMLNASQNQIRQSQKIVQSMSKASKSIIFLVIKSKRRQIISDALQKIKLHSVMSSFEIRNRKRKGIRKMLQFILRDKRCAFDKILISKTILERKQKLRNFAYVLSTHRKQNLSWGVWKLRRNVLDKRRQQVENDIKMFESKINTSNDPQIQAIKEKKDKLQQHLSKIQKQKSSMQEQFMSQYAEVQKQRQDLQNKIAQLSAKKKQVTEQIEQTYKQINSSYSIDQIYQCAYNNFLLYIHQNKQQVYNKEELLKSLAYPLIPVDIPVDTIKQENQVMQELLNQYIVMFGPKKLQKCVQIPYEFLVKQNQVMYKMLITLLPLIEGDRDDLRVIRDSLFKLNAKVGQVWNK